MNQNDILARIDELIKKGEGVLATKFKVQRNSFNTYTLVERPAFEQWAVSSLSLIGRAIGKDSEHYRRFAKSTEGEIALYSKAESALGALKWEFGVVDRQLSFRKTFAAEALGALRIAWPRGAKNGVVAPLRPHTSPFQVSNHCFSNRWIKSSLSTLPVTVIETKP